MKRVHEMAENDVVVLSAGTWDLRDDTVEAFLGDLARFLEASRAQRSEIKRRGARVFWRTAPPYSFHKSMWQGREGRTNEKLAAASIGAKELAAREGLEVWDSYRVLAARWDSPCDTHHYLCGKSPFEPGVDDLSVFLSLVCRRPGL